MCTQIAKYCCLPVCSGEKFNLVHKFPSDNAKYQEWINVVKKSSNGSLPEKMKSLDQDQIKKRFFICSRHFGLNSYKNLASRSLNLTAIPHLNLVNLNQLEESKAYQIESMPTIEAKISNKVNIATPSPKILNKECKPVIQSVEHEVVSYNSYGKSSNSAKLHVTTKNIPQNLTRKNEPVKDEIVEVRNDYEPTQSPPKIASAHTIKRKPVDKLPWPSSSKKQKILNESPNMVTSKNTNAVQRQVTTPPVFVEKKVRNEKDSESSQNKLLALFEVTPDQYKELAIKLSASEQSTKVENLICSFIDNDDTECVNENEIEIKISDDKTVFVDSLWLRDHCRCDNCYDNSTFQRKINILELLDDTSAKSFNVKNNKLSIIWDDNHKSEYDIDFILKNQFGISPVAEKPTKVLWTVKDSLLTLCRCKMRDYMSDPDVSKGVLSNLHQYGVAFIDGVQPTQQNTEFVIRQLFPIHKTLFGEMWTFSDEKKEHADTAYTSGYLGPHNDNTYFNDASGLQILHCIHQQCTGGENFLIDGFQVAAKIKETQPEIFKRLTTTLVPAEYIEENRHHKYMAPIIKLHPFTNEIEQIRFNVYDRAPLNTLPRDKIRQFYKDLKFLAQEMENPENRITFKLEPGTVVIYDNWRVLHGRNAYDGKRTMTGCYVQRTEYLSSLRTNGFIE